jgi:hypothetical protein
VPDSALAPRPIRKSKATGKAHSAAKPAVKEDRTKKILHTDDITDPFAK